MIGFLVYRIESRLPRFAQHEDEPRIAIVWASDREHCKRVLREALARQRIVYRSPDEWVIEPITPAPMLASARIMQVVR